MARYRIRSVGMRGHVHLYEEPRPLDNNTYFSIAQTSDPGRTVYFASSTLPAVSFRGDRYAVTGAGIVGVYRLKNGSWSKQVDFSGDIADGYGTAVSISGNYLAVGAPGTNNGAGRVYLYEDVGKGWAPASRPYLDGQPGSHFGQSLEMDGTMLVVGAPQFSGQGAVFSYLYDLNQKVWNDHSMVASNTPQAGAQFGYSVSLDKELGLAVGAPGQNVNQTVTLTEAGHVEVFLRNNLSWRFIRNLESTVAAAGDHLGYSVCYRADRIIAGAPGMSGGGGAVVWAGGFDTWVQFDPLLVRSAGSEITDTVGPSDAQGSAVFLDSPNGVAYMAAPGRDTVYVFQLTQAGNWRGAQSPKLTLAALGDNETFGVALAAQNGELMVASTVSGGQNGQVYTLPEIHYYTFK